MLQKPAVKELKLPRKKQHTHLLHSEQRTKFLYGNCSREATFRGCVFHLDYEKVL